MPSQTITLAAGDLFTDTASRKEWRISVQLDADFEPGPTDRYIRRIQARNDQGQSSFRYRLFFDETGVAPQTESASDLVDEWETADIALTFAQGSNTLDVPGPDNADNELRDSGDNYVWDPPAVHVPFAGDFFFSLFDSSAGLTVTFRFPDPPPPPPPVVGPAQTLEVDWDNDGTYGNANADVWPRLIRRDNAFRCKRGRNYGSQRTGRSIAGTLSARLDNRDGRFNPQNSQAPRCSDCWLAGGVCASGWRMRTATLQTQWTGWLDDIPQTERVSGLDTINLRALGVFSRLERPVTIAHQTAITVEDAGALLFDPDGSIGSADANVDGADYRASDIEGKRTMARWWVDDLPRLQALRELEQTEAGFALEEKDGFVGLQPFDRRSAASSRIVRATLTDSPTPAAGDIPVLQSGFIPDEALRDLANQITTKVRQFGTAAAQTLWSATNLVIPGNTPVPVTIRYPGPSAPRNHVGADSWTTPVAGTDYAAQSGVAVAFASAGNEATITFTNTGGQATFPSFEVRGVPAVELDPITIPSQDADSIADVGGVYPYQYPAPWLSNIGDVLSQHGFLLQLFASPAERVTAKWVADRDLAAATSIDLSDRVTANRRLNGERLLCRVR